MHPIRTILAVMVLAAGESSAPPAAVQPAPLTPPRIHCYVVACAWKYGAAGEAPKLVPERACPAGYAGDRKALELGDNSFLDVCRCCEVRGPDFSEPPPPKTESVPEIKPEPKPEAKPEAKPAKGSK